MPALGEEMRSDHKENIRNAVLARQAWVRDTVRLREAVEADDEPLARLLLRKLMRERRKIAAAEEAA